LTASDSTRPDVSIVIVSYNTRELTLECLRTIFAETHRTALEVVVVDNASADGSARAVRERFPALRVIPLADNFGFGRAVNHGAERCTGRYLLLLNPDTRILDGAIDRLVALADGLRAARIFGGVTLNDDGSINPSSCWRRPSAWSVLCQGLGLTALFPRSRLFSPQTVRVDPHRQTQDVDIVSGGFLLIDRELWVELEGFDPAYFFYGEDFDLCLRAARRGASPVVFPSVRIVHHGGRSPLANAERLVRLFRAQTRLYATHWSAAENALGRAALISWILTRRLAYRVAGRSNEAQVWDEVWRRRVEFLTGRVDARALPPIRELSTPG
jgi:GT2 family glycosyltransferase